MQSEKYFRQQLLAFLSGAETHMGFEEATDDFPINLINVKPPNVPYTPWHVVEHLRICQWDMLDFMINPNYQEIEWPRDYWPERDIKATPPMWKKSISGFKKDLAEIIKIAKNPKTDLYFKIPWGTGQTILREIFQIIDHNSYHIGELAILRQVLNGWPKDHKV